jgi:lysine-specific demethylase/histidyl-hydroxylase NO66
MLPAARVPSSVGASKAAPYTTCRCATGITFDNPSACWDAGNDVLGDIDGGLTTLSPSPQHLEGTTIDSVLAWLLQPLTVENFLDGIWGTTHYHVKRGSAGYFDGLFDGPLSGSSAVDELLAHVAPEPSTVRLVRGGEDKPVDTYRRPDGALDLVRVRGSLAEGYTIVVNAVEQYVRRIATLAHSIEVELNFPTRVNAYVTPPGSTGFVPHYDPHDVLVLQIQGSKMWHLSTDADVPPHLMQRGEGAVAAGLPLPIEVLLQAGDVLYVPRGRVHAAETLSEQSVHFTVGIHAPTVLTLVTHALYLLSLRDDGLHARLPPRHLDDAGIQAGLAGLVRDAVKTIEDPGAIAAALGAMADVLVSRGRCPQVRPVSHAVGVDGQTLVVKYQPLYSRVTAVAGGFALQFGGLLIRQGPDHEAAMLFVSRCTEPFRVRELPGLRPEQQIELARTLIATGFLVRLPED